ncbi:hypothetical protein VTO73DRAFT_11486 [Trametes versicolor]
MSEHRGPPASEEGDLALNMLLPSDAAESFALLRSMLDILAGPIPGTVVNSSSDNLTRLAELANAGIAHKDIRRLLRKLEDDRRRFRARYDLPPLAHKSCTVKLLTLAFRRNAGHRAAVKGRLATAANHARRLNANVGLQGLLHTLIDTSAEVDLGVSEVANLFENCCANIPTDAQKTLTVRFGAIKHVVTYCADDTKRLCARLVNARSCLEVLTLPQDEFQALIEHLPVYSSKGRLGEALECLRRVTSECDAIQSSFNAQKADMTTIVDKLQAQAALQSDAFDAVHAELEAAEHMLDTVQTDGHVYKISDLVDSLSTYKSVQSNVGGALERQAKARDALKEIRHDFLTMLSSL